MSKYPISIKPYGDSAVLIEWPAKVDESILYDILVFRDLLNKEFTDASQWEWVPAYNSLTLISNKKIENPAKLIEQLKNYYAGSVGEIVLNRQLWKLPVCYDEEFGLDLEEISGVLGRSVSDIIELHTSHVYTVYGIGFLPGFMYLGGLPEALELPRRESPRMHVPSGSVGLAGKQTGIYPQDSPGGWNIIGNCPIPIFNVEKEEPCFVNIGDHIQFYQVNRASFDLHRIEAEVGIYNIENSAVDV